MELITLESEVWKQLQHQIETLHNHCKEAKKETYKNGWFNQHKICTYLPMGSSTLTQIRKVRELIDSENKRQSFHFIGTLRSLLSSRMLRSKKIIEKIWLQAPNII